MTIDMETLHKYKRIMFLIGVLYGSMQNTTQDEWLELMNNDNATDTIIFSMLEQPLKTLHRRKEKLKCQ